MMKFKLLIVEYLIHSKLNFIVEKTKHITMKNMLNKNFRMLQLILNNFLNLEPKPKPIANKTKYIQTMNN